MGVIVSSLSMLWIWCSDNYGPRSNITNARTGRKLSVRQFEFMKQLDSDAIENKQLMSTMQQRYYNKTDDPYFGSKLTMENGDVCHWYHSPVCCEYENKESCTGHNEIAFGHYITYHNGQRTSVRYTIQTPTATGADRFPYQSLRLEHAEVETFHWMSSFYPPKGSGIDDFCVDYVLGVPK